MKFFDHNLSRMFRDKKNFLGKKAHKKREEMEMKNLITVLLCVLCATACIEDGAPLPRTDTPDACPCPNPPDSPTPVDAGTEDCAPPDQPAAPTLDLTAQPQTIVSGDSSTVSWTTSSNTTSCSSSGGVQPTSGSWLVYPTTTTTYTLTCTGPGGSVTESVTVTVNPAQTGCTCDEDCDDGRSWTGEACTISTGKCVRWAIACGGMQVRPASNTADCQFWSGFGTSEPAPSLGKYSPSSLSTGPSGGNWKSAPANACSVICYNPGSDVETTVDIQIEWNGTGLQHQEITGLKKGTWDGKNLRY